MTSAHDRMVASASRLLSLDGLEGTSFSTVLADSGAPRGSIYHHFPDGKEQLISEAVVSVGAALLASIAEIEPSSPQAVVIGFAGPWRDLLVRSGNRAGCGVAAVAVAGGAELRPVAGTVFEAWVSALAELLERSGLDDATAARFASTLLAAIEGALVISRAEGDLEPFDRVVEDMTILAAALDQRRGP